MLDHPVGVKGKLVIRPMKKHDNLSATIFSGPLLLHEGKNCQIFDIMGRIGEQDKMRPGIYFIQIDEQITNKVVKVR